MKKRLITASIGTTLALMVAHGPASAAEVPPLPIPEKRIHIDYGCRRGGFHLCSQKAWLAEQVPPLPVVLKAPVARAAIAPPRPDAHARHLALHRAHDRAHRLGLPHPGLYRAQLRAHRAD